MQNNMLYGKWTCSAFEHSLFIFFPLFSWFVRCGSDGWLDMKKFDKKNKITDVMSWKQNTILFLCLMQANMQNTKFYLQDNMFCMHYVV